MYRVVVTVRGGVAEVIEIPGEIEMEVEVRDYDIDGVDEGELENDSEGELCLIRIYS